MTDGKVYLVGAGPGEVGLLTLKALDRIRSADVIVYDKLVNVDLLKFARADAQLIYAGKSPKGHTLTQNKINRLLIDTARSGRCVVRLKGGDPFLFGRGAEEAVALAAAGIPFEVVPGVSSALAVPELAGIPLTHRRYASTLHIVTGHEDPRKRSSCVQWKRLLGKNSTLVILMGMANLCEIVKRLRSGKVKTSMPVAVVANGSLSAQRIVTGSLKDIVEKVESAGIEAPAVIIVGEVVRMRDKLSRKMRGTSLGGRTVLVTRPKAQAASFRTLLEERGAKVFSYPLIRLRPTNLLRGIVPQLRRGDAYRWIVFTSANGVKHFFDGLNRYGVPAEALAAVRFATIGPKTAERLEEYGFISDIVPEEFRQESLAGEIERQQGDVRCSILIVGAEESRVLLREGLSARGHHVDFLPIYRTELLTGQSRRIRELIRKKQIDAVTLTSSSCVRAFAGLFAKEDLGKALERVAIAVIGPVSAATAHEMGLRVDVVPPLSTAASLADALTSYYLRA